ncbi:ead/Ea22-like family protein [Escherichia coli]|uniref:ead/Ea22-like family protein n=1 Tax=Escherichia coli TaxID=562 RepID=UPI000DD967EB|nr:ead/Ea22-like family protein [Escherichia coli]HBD1054408.1 ead/Ea22-like family protein [Escherichia coli]
MSNIDYQALREKAEKATSGVWSLEYGEERFDAGDALIHREVVGYLPICRIEGAHPESGFDEDFQMEQQANAEFIAAANPATVLALLDELETAKKRIAELKAEPVSQTYKLNQLSGNSPVTQDSWISCSERIPAQDDWVLIYSKHGEYMAGQVQGEYVELSDGTLSWLGNALFWMPLPEPPRLKEL